MSDSRSEKADSSPFARPAGAQGSFQPPAPETAEQPTPGPQVSATDREAFSAPAGSGAAFAPAPGDRLPARHDNPARRPVPAELAQAFAGAGSFAPAPGDRLAPSMPGPGSPWWKPDAATDPWRDPQSPYWIAGPPVYADDEVIGMSDAVEDPEPTAAASASPGKRARFGLSALAMVLVAGLVAGLIGGGVGYWLSDRANAVLTDPNVKLAKTDQPANRPAGSVADIAKRVSPAVVSIDVRSADAAGSGSGVIIDKGGYILTNNHVIAFAATPTIRVVFADRSSSPAKVVGTDPRNDLAVIKVAKTDLTVATLGDSDSLAVGDPVVAIGDPLGLRGTVTAGIVSALNRPLRLPGENGEPDAVIDAVQTDASINPGNSGGALVDAAGAVVGINTAIASVGQSSSQSGNIGVGFAIPVNTARSIAEELIQTGKVRHADLGASSRSVTDGTRDGAYLVQVVPDGPAAKAGLKEGDVVTLFGDNLIDSGDALTVAVAESKPGATVTLRYVRDGVTGQAKVILGSS
ncbi:MAG TPA: trypsin-like peptidase domain-containing protein [Jatrophihabitans sp.]|uniref:S1C family serine protease n=1 Tax=Jatrophihabitans sp. TaxID=1932789 RepID=UPI002EEE7741